MRRISLYDPSAFRQDLDAKTLSFFALSAPVLAGPELFSEMREHLNSAQQKTLRVCLHSSPQEAHHDMLILARPGHYIPPHHHPDKTETLHLLEGELAVLQYDAQGKALSAHKMKNGELLRISGSSYFFLVPLTEVVYHESKPGPWNPAGDMTVAGWAPVAGDTAAIQAFTEKALKLLETLPE